MAMIKLIILDWDDVFTLGSKEGYFECFHQTLTDLKIYLDPEIEKMIIISRWGKHPREIFKKLLKDKFNLLEQASERYEEKYLGETFISALKLLKGVNEFLVKLSKKYTLALATGQHPKVFWGKIVPSFNVPADVFAQIIFSYDIDDPKKQKPHPHALEKIMKDQGFNPEETIFVGDAKSDVLMAQNADVIPVVVLTGHLTKKEAEELGVKYIIEDLTYLEDEVLNKMND